MKVGSDLEVSAVILLHVVVLSTIQTTLEIPPTVDLDAFLKSHSNWLIWVGIPIM